MKTILLLFVFFPIFILAQADNKTLTENLAQAKELYGRALFTESAKICEHSVAIMNKENTPLLYVDFQIVYAADLYKLSKYEKAITVLDGLRKTIEKEDRGNSLRLLDVLNTYARCYYMLSDCHNMKHSLEEALSLFAGKTKDNKLAVTYDYLGMYWGDMSDAEKAAHYFKKAKAIREGNKHTDPLSLYLSLLNLSHFESLRGNDDGAISMLLEGFEIAENASGSYLDKATLSFAIALSFLAKYDFDAAIQYLDEGLYLITGQEENVGQTAVEMYGALGSAYFRKGEMSLAKQYYEKAFILLENRDGLNAKYRKGVLLADFAFWYKKQGKFDSADSMLVEAASLLKESANGCGWLDLQLSQVQTARANILQDKGEYEASIIAYKDNIRQMEERLGANSPFIPAVLHNLGLTYHSLSQYDSANVYYERALLILNQNGKDLLDFGKVISPIEYSYIIWNRAENNYFKYQENGDVASLNDALSDFSAYTHFLDYLRGSYRAEGSKVGFAEENKIAYEKCIQIICELQKHQPDQELYESAFSYLEKSKSMTLLEAVKKSQAVDFAGIPPGILATEDSIRNAVGQAEVRYFNYLSKFDKESEEITVAKSAFFKASENYYRFQDWLKKEHASYYKAKYNPDLIPLEQVKRQLLADNETMIQYYEGDENLFIFVINRDGYQVVDVKKDFPLSQWVQDLRAGLQSFHTLLLQERTDERYSHYLNLYIESATQLYAKLITPIEPYIKEGEKLVIIPDGQLTNIPFEALLKGKPRSVSNFNSYPFFIRDHVLSYCYSATLLSEMKNKKHKTACEGKLLAIAPFPAGENEVAMRQGSISRDSEGTLPYSGEEVKVIAKLMNGETVLGQEATETYFKNACSGYGILHLSTHGHADAVSGANSYLVFSDTVKDGRAYLHVQEIYNLLLNTDMVVLSACETNLGELQVGEGVISVARAFAYAGTKSVLTTLWKVDDEATKNLSILFYKYLQTNPKDDALHLAKQEALSGTENDRKHPYFWASMVAIGDMSAME